MSRIFLIPGLGADCRIYKNINLDGHEVIMVNWINPEPEDTLNTYSQSIINQFNIAERDVVIGNSMGGIVAVEIAKQIDLKKAIIISSIKTDSEAPRYFYFFRKYPLYRYIPDNMLVNLKFLLKPLFGKISKKNAELFVDMLENTPPEFIKWAMKAILDWRNSEIPASVYHITGNKDAIFPDKYIKNAQIINNGSHLMIFTKAKEINQMLKQLLAE
ncbi:alpha/beta hydrolase [Mucilaginibacter limnophilus]|uniref:Alpha/beta hydrolase n=1 Tax=Mucilaginibacter limnophilus TaxID=1932778 RepID=A0A3S2UL76_9SPHI|nr:alpha/beta hydrolase [Mucilaginibacter limnophilus]RVU00950.1 alpha/beta hydrolase [Mucilaginibacter limnophilus]